MRSNESEINVFEEHEIELLQLPPVKIEDETEIIEDGTLDGDQNNREIIDDGTLTLEKIIDDGTLSLSTANRLR